MIFWQNYCFFLKEVCFLRNFQLFKDVTHTILSVDHTKMDERIPHALIVDSRGDVVSHGLDVVGSIAHCHADTGLPDDGDVVATVAKGHRLVEAQVLMSSHGHESFALVSVFLRDVDEFLGPAASDTMGYHGHELSLFLVRDERRHLQDGLPEHIAELVEVEVCQSQSFPEALVHDRLTVVDSNGLPPNDDGCPVETVAGLQDLLHVSGIDRVAAHRLVAYKAVSAIGRDVAVDEMLDLREVGDELYRPARGDKNLHAARLCLCECIDRRLRYAVSAETHQRTINIEK